MEVQSTAVYLCHKICLRKPMLRELWIIYHVDGSDQDILRYAILTQRIISKTQQTQSNANCVKLAMLTDCECNVLIEVLFMNYLRVQNILLSSLSTWPCM